MCISFYAKKGCVFCEKLEQLLKDIKIPYEKIYPDPGQIAQLKELTKMKTFPMVFIGKECIGGFTEFNTLYITNGLEKKLKLFGIDLEI